MESVTEAAGSLASQSAGSLCDSARAGVTASMDSVGDAVSVAIQSGRDAREVGGLRWPGWMQVTALRAMP